jgi:proline iminopeptidase
VRTATTKGTPVSSGVPVPFPTHLLTYPPTDLHFFTMPRDHFLAFRRSLGPTPRLDRMTVRVRGLELAVWTSPPVERVAPLLLVNGGLLYDHALLWPSLSPLAAARQVILYDQRGRGASQPPADPATARLTDDADDIGALRRALGIRQWNLLGHSWGGMIALLGAAGDPAGTRSVVTVDAVGPTSAWMPVLHANALARASAEDRATLERTHDLLSAPDPDVHSEHSRAAYASWFADPAFGSYFTPPASASVTGATIAALLRREGYDFRKQLRALSAPTLVLHGERDALPAAVALELSELLPHARHVLLPDAGHMPFWEAPERFFTLVDDFLAAPSTGPPRPSR